MATSHVKNGPWLRPSIPSKPGISGDKHLYNIPGQQKPKHRMARHYTEKRVSRLAAGSGIAGMRRRQQRSALGAPCRHRRLRCDSGTIRPLEKRSPQEGKTALRHAGPGTGESPEGAAQRTSPRFRGGLVSIRLRQELTSGGRRCHRIELQQLQILPPPLAAQRGSAARVRQECERLAGNRCSGCCTVPMAMARCVSGRHFK